MLKVKFYLVLLLAITLAPNFMNGSGNRTETDQVICTDHHITPQVLHHVIQSALVLWPERNYGELRAAYNHGDMIVWYSQPHSTPNYPAYFVRYDGIEICVTIPI
jgi:hypothetical protein